jgi:hypothetical protein
VVSSLSDLERQAYPSLYRFFLNPFVHKQKCIPSIINSGLSQIIIYTENKATKTSQIICEGKGKRLVSHVYNGRTYITSMWHLRTEKGSLKK